jgi:hypothetical protein
MKTFSFTILFSLAVHFSFQGQTWQWGKILSQNAVAISALKIDKQGNIYTALPDGIYNASSSLAFCNNWQFMAKHDSLGQIMWIQTHTVSSASVNDISFDSANNLYVTGTVGSSTLCGGTSANAVVTSTSGSAHAFIAKYLPNGDLAWISDWGNPSMSLSGSCINTDASGNSYVAASGFNQYGYVMHLKRFNASGQELWKLDIFGGVYGAYVADMDMDHSSNCYITGTYQDSLAIGNSVLYENTPSCSSCATSFIGKIDALGNVIWLKNIAGNDLAWHINLDQMGYFFLDGDCSPSCTPWNAWAKYGFIQKYDISGNNVWSITSAPQSRSSAVDSKGNLYTTGFFQASLVYGSGVNSFTVSTNKPHGDFVVTRYNSSGVADWAIVPVNQTTTGANYSDILAVNSKDELFVSGKLYEPCIFGNDTLTPTNAPYQTAKFLAKIGEAKSPVGIKEYITEGLEVFPNPADNEISIILPEHQKGTAQIYIKDIVGNSIMSIDMKNTSKEIINISSLTKGMYFAEVRTERSCTIRRFCKE